MPGPPTKRARIEISAAKKQEICRYKEENQKATQQDIVRHFSLTWGTAIGRSTISADVEKIREELRCIISEYELSDVYNMDETGLFYRLEPDATLATGTS